MSIVLFRAGANGLALGSQKSRLFFAAQHSQCTLRKRLQFVLAGVTLMEAIRLV